MEKGQSFIIEFILFFFISFSIFITISFFFYSQNTFFQERIGNKSSELIADVISTDIIHGINCKSCEMVLITENIPSQVGSFFYKIQLDKKGLNITLIAPEYSSEKTSVFNLNETFDFLESESNSENKIIGIKINNAERKIGVE